MIIVNENGRIVPERETYKVVINTEESQFNGTGNISIENETSVSQIAKNGRVFANFLFENCSAIFLDELQEQLKSRYERLKKNK